MKRTFLFSFFAIFAAFAIQAQSPVGIWKTIDDKTGEAKSQVQVYEQNGKLYGKVIKFLRKDADPNRKCVDCSGTRKNQPIMGMVIVWDLKPSGSFWKGGTILDPENGNEYSCSFWFESGKPDELKVRGYHWTGLYRTQSWYRVK